MSLASQSVIMTTDQVLNTIPFGIGVAASARVGNLLGARDAKGAARAANTAAVLSIILGAAVMTVMLIVKDYYAKIFSDDADVIKLTAQVMPLVALFQIADGLNGLPLQFLFCLIARLIIYRQLRRSTKRHGPPTYWCSSKPCQLLPWCPAVRYLARLPRLGT